jgi:predicted enzyme related to lactoylglutathione lyase
MGSGGEEEPLVSRHGGISYLRVPATDPRRSAAFYEDVFGWTVDAPIATIRASPTERDM